MKNSFLTAVILLAMSYTTNSVAQDQPNILVIWGNDIGTWNISHNNRGMMGYQAPNIDSLARAGDAFTDYCGRPLQNPVPITTHQHRLAQFSHSPATVPNVSTPVARTPMPSG